MRSVRRPLLLWLMAWVGLGVLPGTECLAADSIELLAQEIPPCITSNNPPKGACIEVASALSKIIQVPITYTLLPYGRARMAATLAGNRIWFGLLERDINDKPTHAIVSVLQIGLTLLPSKALANAGVQLTDPNFWAKHTIGHLRGGCDIFDTALQGATAKPLSDFQSGLKQLESGEIDAFCVSTVSLSHAFNSSQLDWKDFGPPVLVGNTRVWLFGSSTLEPGLQLKLHHAVLQLQNDGTIARIMAPFQSGVPPQVQLRAASQATTD